MRSTHSALIPLALLAAVLAVAGCASIHPRPAANTATLAPGQSVPAQLPNPATTVVAPAPGATTAVTAGLSLPAPGTRAPAPLPSMHVTALPASGQFTVTGDDVQVRSEPNRGASSSDSLSRGDTVSGPCPVFGDPVPDPDTGQPDTVWLNTSSGGYVSDAYLAPHIPPSQVSPEC